MYPETDIPPLEITSQRWEFVMNNLPMTQEERSQRLSGYEISKDQLNQLLSRELDDDFVAHSQGLPQKGLGDYVTGK